MKKPCANSLMAFTFLAIILEKQLWCEAMPQVDHLRQDNIPSPSSQTHTRTMTRSMKLNDVCNVIIEQEETFVNCSRKDLVSIPSLPLSSTKITLDHNQIKNISNRPFSGLHRLAFLDLSHNPLTYISPYVFKGLFNLQVLFIRKSMLHVQRKVDFQLLCSDLKKLKTFAMTFSYAPVSYLCDPPNLPFKHPEVLSSVDVLELDASIIASVQMSSSNSSIGLTKKITIKDEGHVCLLQSLGRSQLSAFPLLQNVSLYNYLSYTHIDHDAFESLLLLEKLHIYDQSSICNDPDEDISLNFYSALVNVTSSLSKLTNFNVLHFQGENDFCMRYNVDNISLNANFSQSKSFRSIIFEHIGLYVHSSGDISRFPDTLVQFTSTGNCLGVHTVMDLIERYPNIEIIDVRNQQTCQKFGHMSIQKMSNELKQAYLSKLQQLYFSHCIDSDDCSDLFLKKYSLPNLKKLELSWFENIDATGVFSTFLERSPFLESVDLTGNKMTTIGKDTFRNTKGLKYLYLSYNALGRMGLKMNAFLNDLTMLESLNIASNGITDLSEYTFTNLSHLRVLDISNNSMTGFVPSVAHIQGLRLLNLSYNYLTALSTKLTADLNMIGKHNYTEVDLTGNPLLCTCQTLDFLKWMNTTNVIISGKYKLSCDMSNGSKVILSHLKHIVDSLEYECQSNTVLYIVTSVSAALCMAVLISALVYRYRWRLRYLYYMAKLRFAHNPADYERIFEYDAFISYATDDFKIARTECMDHLERGMDLKLCLHERDFEPGEAIAYNISVGIHSSKRTILFISDAFLQSEWCLYELNIARQESLHTNRTVLLIVILESAVINKVPIDILDLIRTVTYLEYPEHGDVNDVTVFWNKLTDFIKGK